MGETTRIPNTTAIVLTSPPGAAGASGRELDGEQ